MTKGVGENVNIVLYTLSSLAFSPPGNRAILPLVIQHPSQKLKTGHPTQKTTPQQGFSR
jgi:hypothetical protein